MREFDEDIDFCIEQKIPDAYARRGNLLHTTPRMNDPILGQTPENLASGHATVEFERLARCTSRFECEGLSDGPIPSAKIGRRPCIDRINE